MQILLLLFLFISQNIYTIQLDNQETQSVKRDVHSSSIQNFNRYTKTYETNHEIIIDTPDFKFIDTLISENSNNKSSVREHTTWLIHRISSNNYRQLARFDRIQNRFIVNHDENFSCIIHETTGQLILQNNNNENLLHYEIILHAESGFSPDDDILHDIYRFIHLLPTTLNCTKEITIHANESIDISCSIDYEFVIYNDYQPTINLSFYLKQKDSSYRNIISKDFDEIKNSFNWKRSIKYTIESIDSNELNREYICIITLDPSKNVNLFVNNHRICRTKINIKHDNSSTIILTRINQWNFINILITILIGFSSVLFLTSLILCCIARQYNKKHHLQIIPKSMHLSTKIIALPLETKPTLFSNNNEMPLLSSSSSHRHKPGCPQYIPLPENNLLSTDLFTHTTIDNIKKIILPDIPETGDLFDDQPYIHFYLPSKSETLPIQSDSSENKQIST
ncbi:hypothetical protein I4U23_028170 [Adineta vaga]|nr:hypothetical protein I4U23_028170 [Adineta vaga]